MKQLLNLPLSRMSAAILLGGALTFAGCSEAPKPEASATPSATSATLAKTPKSAGDLGAAKISLEKAVVDLQAKNYTSAANHVDAASKEIAAATANANLPTPIKETITRVGANLEPLKALIEKQDASAEKGLLASIASLGKLAELTKLLSGSGALGGMMKSTTETTNEATKKDRGK